MNVVEQIIEYEDGNLSFPETVKFFAGLLRTGTAWKLQGTYGRVARQLIERGYVSPAGEVLCDLDENETENVHAED